MCLPVAGHDVERVPKLPVYSRKEREDGEVATRTLACSLAFAQV